MDLRRVLSRYVDEELRPPGLRRLEAHLLDCAECRSRLEQVRTGHLLAHRIPTFKPQRDPWLAIRAAMDRNEQVAIPPFSRPLINWHSHLDIQSLFGLALVVALLCWLAVLRQHQPFKAQTTAWTEPSIDRREFHEVSIAGIERNTEPHIVAEGYVSEVRINSEENDLSFKLVEEIGKAKPFIVCEIIDPLRLTLPTVGSRVRVYGVSRFDGKVDHQWYEVHPVLNIEVVKH